MTRKEILEWGREMADKIFHKKKDEMTVKGWLARDEDGGLYYYKVKPYKQHIVNLWKCTNMFETIILPHDCFLSIKWEDEEPTPCEITIKLKK